MIERKKCRKQNLKETGPVVHLEYYGVNPACSCSLLTIHCTLKALVLWWKMRAIRYFYYITSGKKMSMKSNESANEVYTFIGICSWWVYASDSPMVYAAYCQAAVFSYIESGYAEVIPTHHTAGWDDFAADLLTFRRKSGEH